MKCDWCPPKCDIKFPPCFKLHPGRRHRGNPGNITDLHSMAHRVMPLFFDGLELDYAHRLAANKFITSNWVLSHTRPSGFRLGGIYTMVLKDDLMNTPMIVANIHPTRLASNVGIQYFPFNNLRMEASLQRAAENTPLKTQLTLELLRPSSTLTANLYNTMNSDNGRGTLSFMRSITDRWALGAELLLEWREGRGTRMMGDVALATRYTWPTRSLAATASRQALDISYWQQLHGDIQMASMLAWNRKTKKAIAAVCYQWDFGEAVVRGMFKSDLSVGFMYYRTLSNIPCRLGLSVLINLPTNRFSFGLKFNLDPSGLRRDEVR